MTNNLLILIEEVLLEIHEKEKKYEKDNTYPLIARQLEFIQDCIKNKKSIIDELDGRELNYGIIASRNFSGPEEELEEKIGEITTLLRNHP